MYEAFYGFTNSPFARTADPRFLYPSENYQDCVFYLLSGLAYDPRFLVLTGESGTGKTFLLHTVVHSLDEKTHVAFVVHGKLTALELFHYACREWGLDITGLSKAAALLRFKQFLHTQAMNNDKVILIIDEAHHLSVDVLEELHLLTNFEAPARKALSIILVGQLPLEETLKRPELTPLSQRIGSNCRLLPLQAHETQGYIEKRLAVAGVTERVFTTPAIQEIWVRSAGLPSVINLICHGALVRGFTHDQRAIGRPIIKQVMQGLNLYAPAHPMRSSSRHAHDAPGGYAISGRRSRRLALVGALAVFSLLGTGVVLHSALARRTLREETTRAGPSAAVVVPQPPGWHDPPLLPQRPGWRDPPLLPR
jgi:general secretion pathway protein A